MVNVYMKIPGFIGTVSAQNFIDQIELSEPNFGMSLGVSNAVGSLNNRVSGTPFLYDFFFSKKRDSSSINFWTALFSKRPIPTIEVNWVQTDSGAYAYRVVTLTNGIVSSFNSSMSGNEIVENGSINFTQIQIKDQTMGADNEPRDSKTAEYDAGKLKTE